MSTTTILRSVGGIDDVRAVLSNSTLRRRMSIGSNWTKIRIGLLWSMDVAASITSTPRFAMGVCAGTTNPFNNGVASTDHFVGAVTSSATWTFDTSFVFGNSFLPATRVGTTLATGSSIVGLGIKNVSSNVRQMLFLDITKGSPDFTLNVFGINPVFALDVPKASFEELVGYESPSYTDYLFGTARTIAVDEGANGSLNAVNVAWDRTAQKVELSAVAIVRFQ